MVIGKVLGTALVCLLWQTQSRAQSGRDTAVLEGLAPISSLYTTTGGRAALGANFAVTGGIQTGTIIQPTLLPFSEEQQLALRDVFSTRGNLAQLSDGLGATLGAAYVARSHYVDRTNFTSISPAVAEVIFYADALSRWDATSAKYLFANATTDGTRPASDAAQAILRDHGGVPDPLGRAYGFPASATGSNKYGNSRPFQTEPSFTRIIGPDYFNSPADNYVYNRGPIMDLINSPSYPSGHTTYGYTGALMLAILVPDRYKEMIVRGAEYGNDRIIVGAHYAMDVIAGRTLALYDVAHLLANDPSYMGRILDGHTAIVDFRATLKTARADVVRTLQTACGRSVEICAHEDTGRFSDAAANEAFYASTQTYGLPVVYLNNADVLEDVARMAPEAGYLLTAAFPSLSLHQADEILTETEGPGGGFLDNGSPFGLYSRLNLYAAASRAARLAAAKSEWLPGAK
jgi:hypothetical protein